MPDRFPWTRSFPASQVADLLVIDAAVAERYPHLPPEHVLYGDAADWDMTPGAVDRRLGGVRRDERFPDVPRIGILPTHTVTGRPMASPFVHVLFVGWDDTSRPSPQVLALSLGNDNRLRYFLSVWKRSRRQWAGWLDLGPAEPAVRFQICYQRLCLRARGDRSARSRVNLVDLSR